MNQLKVFSTIIFLLLSLSVFSQQFKGGLLLGMSTSQIDGDTQSDFKKVGLFSGVSVATDFSKVMGAKIELYYVGKGAKKVIDGIEEFKTQLHYVEMPFLLTIKPINRFEFDFGIACSYLIGSKLYEYGETVPDGLNDMLNFDFGIFGSATYYFTSDLGFNVRMEHSLIPIKNNPNWFNYNLSFGLAYKINNSE